MRYPYGWKEGEIEIWDNGRNGKTGKYLGFPKATGYPRGMGYLPYVRIPTFARLCFLLRAIFAPFLLPRVVLAPFLHLRAFVCFCPSCARFFFFCASFLLFCALFARLFFFRALFSSVARLFHLLRALILHCWG